MIPSVSPGRARSARVAVSTLFFAGGMLIASYLPRLPEIRDGLGLSNAQLGAAVAGIPIGGLIAGGFAGLLIARFGSGRVGPVAGVLAALAVVGLGLASSWATLALLFVVLGVFDSAQDASQNAHGVGLQRIYGRSILQSFHGMWAVGGLAAAVVGAVAASAGVPLAIYLGGIGVAIAIVVLAVAPRFLPRTIADAPAEADAGAPPLRLADLPRLLRALGPIALLGILCILLQSGATTWSAIYLTDDLGQPPGVAAAAFVGYMATMVVGRFTNDRWVDRWGPTWVVVVGALICVVGVVAVIASVPLGVAWPAFVGFAAMGYGSSSMFPVMVGSAGTRPGIPAGHGIAISIWLVRLGLVISPALIGVTADALGLQVAFLIPLAAGIAIAVLAPLLTATPLGRRVTVAEAPVTG